MKKFFIILICFSFILSGCSSGKEKTNTKDKASVSKSVSAKSDAAQTIDPELIQSNSDADIPVVSKPEQNSPEPQSTVIPELTPNKFYTMATNSHRPVAVMIDNDNEAARPQIGLESAYIVYEIIVEGGATRFMALFKNYEIEKVGPVRSSRHYFLDYALENDAIYAHAGWSPKAQADIPKLGVNNINGILGVDAKNYWRDNTYDKTYHNLYTSVKRLSDHAKKTKGYSLNTNDSVLNFSKTDSESAGSECKEVNFKYSNIYKVGYVYNEKKQVYERYINGKKHMSQTGDVICAKNIIIYNVTNYNLKDGENKGRQNINNIGNGEGWYITNGKAEKITWSKSSRTQKTVYKNSNGDILSVNPGLTFIQIIPAKSSVNIK